MDNPKRPAIRSKAIRQSARGERCTIEFVGICNHDPSTVVFCHLHDETRGGGRKADDTAGVYGCSACHDALDRRTHGLSDAILNWHLLRALMRTIRRLVEKGVIRVPLDEPIS